MPHMRHFSHNLCRCVNIPPKQVYRMVIEANESTTTYILRFLNNFYLHMVFFSSYECVIIFAMGFSGSKFWKYHNIIFWDEVWWLFRIFWCLVTYIHRFMISSMCISCVDRCYINFRLTLILWKKWFIFLFSVYPGVQYWIWRGKVIKSF